MRAKSGNLEHDAKRGGMISLLSLLVLAYLILLPFGLTYSPGSDLAVITLELAVAIAICIVTNIIARACSSGTHGVVMVGVGAFIRFSLTLSCLFAAKISWPAMPDRYALYAVVFYLALLAAEILRAGRLSQKVNSHPIPSAPGVR